MKTRKSNDSRYDLDQERKVFVYKNLHKNCWSIKQDGLVKAHALEVNLYNASFKVSRVGQQRVRKEKRKNVHAGIVGIMQDDFYQPVWEDYPEGLMIEVTYNPYKHDSFIEKVSGDPRWFATFVRLKEKSVLVEE
jgi:hypothetical protein